MLLFNYIFAFLAFFIMAIPVYAKKGSCAKCSHEGEAKCAGLSIANSEIGTRVCRNGCWTLNSLVCKYNEFCRERPSLHCTVKAEACAGCNEFLEHCTEDFWNICDKDCQVACARKTCAFDSGRCDFDCEMDICRM